eukprot:TRINITY_DN13387_c0_g2_i1.p1 TRINITY_DN13387_c0_g2~~TRINITY_DN13387_c0_g2_i1.p1  ORF type:complete len:370 (-),score=63.12 TRINITY_DN13387_c0_g2_i1:123-1232(-)
MADVANLGVKKSGDSGDSRLLAALTDPRLKGSQQAVYFTLRGLGVPAIDGRDGVMRIEVFAAKQPKLFAALRRLGLRQEHDRIVVEAREDVPYTDKTTTAPTGNSMHGKQWQGQSGTMSQPLERSSQRHGQTLSELEHSEFYERMSWPKGVGKKGPFMSALSESARSLGLVDHSPATREKANAARSVKPGRLEVSTAKKIREGEEGSSLILPSSSQSLRAQAADIPIPSWWRMSNKRTDAVEQQKYCSQLSKPLPRMMRSKSVPDTDSFNTERTQSSEGLLAERHFLARISKLQAMKRVQQAEMQEERRQREQAQQRALLFANAGRGIIPPDPSMSSQDVESRCLSEVSLAGASRLALEASGSAPEEVS